MEEKNPEIKTITNIGDMAELEPSDLSELGEEPKEPKEPKEPEKDTEAPLPTKTPEEENQTVQPNETIINSDDPDMDKLNIFLVIFIYQFWSKAFYF